mgnify:CR=1 FL=1
MSELEDKLNALMSNPQLMQQIAAMAQNMNNTNQEPNTQEPPPPGVPALDLQHMQSIIQAASQNGVDRNQQALLHALTPYLSSPRILKLERAMRAAKMAGVASLFLNSGGLQLLDGR